MAVQQAQFDALITFRLTARPAENQKARFGVTAESEFILSPVSIQASGFTAEIENELVLTPAVSRTSSTDWLAELLGAPEGDSFPGFFAAPDDPATPVVILFELEASPAGSFLWPYEFDFGDPSAAADDGGGGEDVVVTVPAVVRVAAKSLSGHRVVRITSANKLDYPDIEEVEHAEMIVGVIANAYGSGENASAITFGEIVEPSWSFDLGPVFCGPSGTLVQTPPDAAFIRQIGTALASDRIFVSLRPVIVTPN